MDEKIIYPKYRYIVLFAFCLCFVAAAYSVYASAPIITYLAETYQVSIETCGYSSVVATFACGLGAIFSTTVYQKVGYKPFLTMSITSSVLGNIIAAMASSFVLLLVGRFFSGLALGCSLASISTTLMLWAREKERAMVATLAMVALTGGCTIVYSFAIPIVEFFDGNYKAVFIVGAVVSTVVLLIWILVGRDNKAYREYEQQSFKNQTESAGSSRQGMKEALKRPQVWYIVLYEALLTFAVTGIETYQMAELSTVKGTDLALAGVFLGFTSLITVFFTIFGGVITTMFGRRKPVLLLAAIGSAAMCIVFYFATNSIVILVSMLIYSAMCSCRNSSVQIIPSELENTTTEISMATSGLMSGLGRLSGIAIPVVATLVSSIVGFRNLRLFFSAIFILCSIFVMLLKETGPKAKMH